MTTPLHGNISAANGSASLHQSLNDAAQRADRRLVEAAQESERAHRQIERAVHRGVPPTAERLRERRWAGRTDPLVGRLSSAAQHLARQSMDRAAQAGYKAQESWHRYAGATTGYVARQPLRSVLIAAAVGAGIALLVASGRKRY